MKRKQPCSRDILPIMNEEALCQVRTQRCVLFGQQSIVNKSRVIGLSGRSIAVYKHGRPETVNQQSVAQICTQRNGPLLCISDRDAQPSARIHACGPRSVRQGASPVAATLACGRKATLVPRKGRPMQHLFSAATPTPQPQSLLKFASLTTAPLEASLVESWRWKAGAGSVSLPEESSQSSSGAARVQQASGALMPVPTCLHSLALPAVLTLRRRTTRDSHTRPRRVYSAAGDTAAATAAFDLAAQAPAMQPVPHTCPTKSLLDPIKAIQRAELCALISHHPVNTIIFSFEGIILFLKLISFLFW
jgi:hypothetical protein